MNDLADFAQIERAWREVDAVAHLHPIRDEAHYAGLVALMDALLEATRGAGEDHPLAGLLFVVAELVAAYEKSHHPIPPIEGAEMLRWFMERDHLRQVDLPEIGNQAKVSEVLAGKRRINARQAKLLAARFGVGMEVFL